MTPFKLPNSGIMVFAGRVNILNGRSRQMAIFLQPDYWVENSLADNPNGRRCGFREGVGAASTWRRDLLGEN